MKRLFTIVFIAAYGSLWAQNPHVIDTIWNREPTYFYQYWFDSADFCKPTSWECKKDISFMRHTEVAKYNYTDAALSIIGVAAVVGTRKTSSLILILLPIPLMTLPSSLMVGQNK